MNRGLQGKYVTNTAAPEPCLAFIPFPLPPAPMVVEDKSLYERALLALGRLDSITAFLPDPSLFLYLYVRKEAVLSSQIEGTQSSLSDLLLYETTHIPGVLVDDIEEVSQYVAALNHAVSRVRSGEIPICNRLIRDVHGVLLAKGRGK